MINPKISVILPVFNSEKSLLKCLNSIRFQTYQNLEIICIDCVSSDKSGEILSLLQAEDDRIIVFHQENTEGGVIRNKGVEIASGDYISFINVNDWVFLNLYQTFVDSINRLGRDIDIYMFNASNYMFGQNDIIPFVFFDVADWNGHKSEDTIHTFNDCQRPFTNNLCVENKIYNKSFLEKNQLCFNEHLNYEDMYFCIKTLLYAKSILVNDDIFYRKTVQILKEAPKATDIFRIMDLIEKDINKFKFYESFKYALFQFKYNIFIQQYGLCSENLKEAYFNEMKFRLLAAETHDLNKQILEKLRNYEFYEKVKTSTRKVFDKFYIRKKDTI